MYDMKKIVARRKQVDRLFAMVGLSCVLVGLLVLVALLGDLAYNGFSRISWDFLTSFPSRRAANAGILSAWVGSLLIMLVTVATAVPLGVAAGVYLEEYAPKNRLTAIIEINISNLAGVPSIVYGLMALGLFVYVLPDALKHFVIATRMNDWLPPLGYLLSNLPFGRTIFTGGLTLACLVLPVVIVATREALRTIPTNIREAAYAMGASKWQVISHHLLPYSAGGIATGVIIATSRAIGESAPLITIGALTFIAFLPASPLEDFPRHTFSWLYDEFTVLPTQMFNWVSRPGVDFQANAAAAGLVLVVMTLSLNAAAIIVRYRMRKKIKW